VPIVVGGTGLFIDNLVRGTTFADVAADTALRAALQEQSNEALYTALQQCDAAAAAQIHPHNRKRVIRALELAQGGVSKTEQNETKENKTPKDKDKVKDKDKENTPKGVKEKLRFSQPTVEEVATYCRERQNGVDAQRFVDFYAAKGWKIGQNTMKDWKAAVRTWEQRSDSPQKPIKTVSGQQYEQRKYSEDELLAVSGDLLAEAKKRRDSA
jgi:tRNA A37 N6-isopentenylltransferase MiaA